MHAMGDKVIAGEKNVLGGELMTCSFAPLTGYFRDGSCATRGAEGVAHLVCVRATAEFLEFSVARGNDLVTPVPQFHFPGLDPGDKWCLCALRWKEALDAGVAPPVVLAATHEKALEFVSLDDLKRHAVDLH